MMNVLYVCLAITLFQGIQGFGGVGYRFENGDLEGTAYKFELTAPEAQLLRDDAHCDNVSATVVELYKLGVRVNMWAQKSVGVLVNDLRDLFKCSGAKVVPCVVNILKKTKQDVLNLKPAFDEYKEDFIVLIQQLKKELPLCLQ